METDEQIDASILRKLDLNTKCSARKHNLDMWIVFVFGMCVGILLCRLMG